MNTTNGVNPRLESLLRLEEVRYRYATMQHEMVDPRYVRGITLKPDYNLLIGNANRYERTRPAGSSYYRKR